jgi:hypothetical protein
MQIKTNIINLKNLLSILLVLTLIIINNTYFKLDCYGKSFRSKKSYTYKNNLRNHNIKPIKLTKTTGNLKLDQIPFVYNSLYSLKNIENVDNSIAILKNYKFLVCAEPGKLVEKELQVTNSLKSESKIFGYIDMGSSKDLNILKSEIDNIALNNWYGVFIDEFGYDFGETRERQNEIINYIHSLGLKAFVNAWFPEDVFENNYDPVHNPNSLPSQLSRDDWYLMESFLISNKGYISNKENFLLKSQKVQNYKKEFGIKVATLSYKNNNLTWNETLEDIENSYFLSLLMGFDAWWFTDYLEYDDFNHGSIPQYNLGDILEQELTQFKNDYYIAKTNKYTFLYNFNTYPILELLAFKNPSIKELENYIIKR